MAIAVALTAWIKAKEPRSNIDLKLLVQLLRNPGMLEQLTNEHEDPAKPRVRLPKTKNVVEIIPIAVLGPNLEVRPHRTVVGTFRTLALIQAISATCVAITSSLLRRGSVLTFVLY